MRLHILLKGLIISLTTLDSSLVSAAVTNYSVSASIEHSDNINLSSDNERSELSESIKGQMYLEEDATNIEANIFASLETINYANNLVQDENIGRLSADILWKVKPGIFEWFLSDVYTQTAIDILDAVSPLNQQNVNTFVTGPNYIIRVSARNFIRLEGRFTNNSYELNPDSNELQAILRWIYKINNNTELGLNYSSQVVDFESQENNSNYDRSDVFLSLRHVSGLSLFDLEIGSTNINYDDRDNVDAERYMLGWENYRTRTSSIRFQYENILSNTGDELSASLGDIVDELDSSIITTNDTFVKQLVSLSYNKITSYGGLQLTASKLDNDYTNQDIFDHQASAIVLENSLDISPRMNIQLNIRYQKTIYDYFEVDRQDNDLRYDLIYIYRANRNINVNGRVIYRTRESTSLLDQYDEVRFLATLEYIFK